MTVSQNGQVVAPGGTLSSVDPILLSLAFGVPVQGDTPVPANPVRQGDTAVFQLSDAFRVSEDRTFPVTSATGILVGHATISTDPNTKMTTARIVFDGEPEVFSGDYADVKVKLLAEFLYDNSGPGGTGGDHTIVILGKSYNVNVPVVETAYKMAKSGAADLTKKTITWSVDVTATQGENPASLAGHLFTDDLSQVGVFIPGSFQVGGAAVQPVYENGVLRYTFPAGTQSPRRITFQIEIPGSAYYATTAQNIPNHATLSDGKKEVAAADAAVPFTPKWLEKRGASSDVNNGVYDSTNRTITWSVVANLPGANLTGAVVTDLLPAGLTFQEARWQKWDGAAWGPAASITPNAAGEYALRDINSKVLLTIVTKVPDEAYTAGTTTFTNIAKLRWDGLTGPVPDSGPARVVVGYNALVKAGTADPKTRTVHWNIKVDTRGQTIPDLKVYDLIVYGSADSGVNLTALQGGPAGFDLSRLQPRYDQKYVPGSFAPSTYGLKVYTLTHGGVPVADLLEITGFSQQTLNQFTFDTQVVNPAIFGGNQDSAVLNSASLFSANTLLNTADASVPYETRTLRKTLMERGVTDYADEANTGVTIDPLLGYDYLTNTAVFRLNVNATGLDLSGAAGPDGVPLGAITVTDTLPAGWEFVPLTAQHQYMIFDGTGRPDGNVVAVNDLSAQSPATAVFSGATASFTFASLTKPYAILVRAKPTASTVAEYFSKNQTITARNTLAITAKNNPLTLSVYQDVKVVSEIVNKIALPQGGGTLLWYIDYQPTGVAHPGAVIEDTLPVGIDLRTDAAGTPLLAPHITLQKLVLQPDGSSLPTDELPMVLGKEISYDPATRKLTFRVPDTTKGYRLNYMTDITGNPGEVTNQVQLLVGDDLIEDTDYTYSISYADGEATMTRTGWIEITKTGDGDAPLAGVTFTVYAMDGVTPLRTAESDADGKVVIRGLPVGEFLLKETATLSDYVLDSKTYPVRVTSEGGIVSTAVNDQTGAGANQMTVRNYIYRPVEKTEVTGTKVWVKGPASRPAILLQLYRDGTAVGEPVPLADGVTTYTWRGLDKNTTTGHIYRYTVDEVSVPTGYTKTLSADGRTVTNTYLAPPVSSTPPASSLPASSSSSAPPSSAPPSSAPSSSSVSSESASITPSQSTPTSVSSSPPAVASSVPATGDGQALTLFVGALLLALGVALLVFKRRTRNQQL